MKNEAQQAVMEAEERLAAASLNLDLSVFEQLLHPDYVIVQPGGIVENKAETMAQWRNVAYQTTPIVAL